MKHKKRHKEIQRDISTVDEEVDLDVPPLLDEDPLKISENMPDGKIGNSPSEYDSMKEKCLKQKLSINLKRLSATAYTHCGGMSSSAGSDSPGSNSEMSGADELPDFPQPPPDHALVTVGSCLTGDGRTMEVGDVVWGKIHGFPWWPGKVQFYCFILLTGTVLTSQNGGGYHLGFAYFQGHVWLFAYL